MVRNTLPSQDASTHQIWNFYLKECRRYAQDTKRDGQTVRLLYASLSSFGGIKMPKGIIAGFFRYISDKNNYEEYGGTCFDSNILIF